MKMKCTYLPPHTWNGKHCLACARVANRTPRIIDLLRKLFGRVKV